jgi:Tol biopolymer transport system component
MSSHETDLIERLHALAETFEMRDAPPADDVRRGRRRLRRNRGIAASIAAVVVVAASTAIVAVGAPDGTPRPAAPVVPGPSTPPSATHGWVAVDAYEGGGGDIYLVRPGDEARRLDVAGGDTASDACPAWSPDGTRLMFGRLGRPSDSTSVEPQLVIVPVGQNGAVGTPRTIGLNGFDVRGGFDGHPCGIWAPDGRWVALAGSGQVWLVDTKTSAIRRLPDLHPSDLDWRPGTDELAIAGDVGTNRSAPTLSTPVSIYSVSTGELHHLGSVRAAHLTWSADGRTLAYTGGETDPRSLWLVDHDGAHNRLLVAHPGEANHGIGPVWSPTGDRIAYQRLVGYSGESHEVVLVNVADGTQTVIRPPKAGGGTWYPDIVTWSPDGTTLLYTGWTIRGNGEYGGVIEVPADSPRDVTILTDHINPLPDSYEHGWTTQMWARLTASASRSTTLLRPTDRPS